MITSGAFRSIIVKLAYQSGLEAPLTVTLLYLLGQSLSLLVYFIEKRATTIYKDLYTKKEKELREKELQFIGHNGDEFVQDKYVEMGSSDNNENNNNSNNNNNIGGGAQAIVIDDDKTKSKNLSKTISFAEDIDNATLHSTYSHKSKTTISFVGEDVKLQSNSACCSSPYEVKPSFSFGEPSLVGR